MAPPKPTVYLLHGDDTLAIEEFIARLREKIGDAATADMNTQRFSVETADLGAVAQACASLPFLAKRRMVILERASRWMSDPERSTRLLAILESLPQTTAFVLLESAAPKEGSLLLEWASAHSEAAYVRRFEAPQGEAFQRWLVERSHSLGGSLEPSAAQLLAELVADDPHVGDQELRKLLDYVDRQRPITTEDVERLTPFHGQSSVFEMVDALGRRDARLALTRLHRLLEDEDVHYAFAMIVRQFRLLLKAREAMEGGLNPRQVLGGHPFVAEKVTSQARNFTLADLERIYRRLLEMDLAEKTGTLQLDAALDGLVAAISA